MRFFLSLVSTLQLIRYANEGFLTRRPQIFFHGTENNQIHGRRNVSVGIIGAGFAGLSAFNRLVELGFSNVHLFEANQRVGGRVYPLPFEGKFLQNGAEFINGRDNPIFDMATKLNLITGEVDDGALISNEAFFASMPGCQVPPDKIAKFENFTSNLELKYARMASICAQRRCWEQTIGELFELDYAEFLEKENGTDGKSREQFDSLAQVYRNYFAGEWSASIDRLALHNYAQWNDKAHQSSFGSFGSFMLDARGYAPILENLAKSIPSEKLHLGSRVLNIDYSEPRIRIFLQQNRTGKWTAKWPIDFDFIIVTLPIGHLKRFSPTLFTPSLPPSKLEAIQTIGFGAMQKIFLIYDRPFWMANISSFVALSCPSRMNEISENLHTFQPLPWHPERILVAWLSGNGPKLVNELDDEELSRILTDHFRTLFPEIGNKIEPPTKIIRTKWLEDELFLGSYTFITPEASRLSLDPFTILAAPIYSKGGSGHGQQPKVMFAGEGTHSQMYQTTIGAMMSGRREAERLAKYIF